MITIATVSSQVLRGNRMGDPHERRVPIYLPPDYDTSGTRYPVVYFLAGFSGGGTFLLSESLWGETLAQRIDRLVRARTIRPMIVVLADCLTRLGGSQYINSAATGRYEDHLVAELVPFVDATFRTIAERERRAVMGKSSGGYGATVLAMRHPEVFAAAADHSGDKYFELCYKADIPPAVAALARYDHSPARFLAGFPQPSLERGRHWFALVNMLAMASCYSPNADSEVGFDLPFDPRTGELRDAVWVRWLAHDPITLAAAHAEALKRLQLYFLDCGRWDEHHLQLGNRIYCDRLTALGVPHVYEEFEGGHMNVAHRYEVSLQRLSALFA
ncbi:MAG TPA: alpha/beta hydrolase-fold protein [Candidatus Dormibacteraeota bacterium]|nr:alpha/beta hydrolase-fold protein [Candidatus Dormibacteraeota bacterium]